MDALVHGAVRIVAPPLMIPRRIMAEEDKEHG